ncbi:hypothetical protein [Streptomyces griseosporeus]|uniref:hypothetical protein n=1 Tax=Streptomyces griseosporeus TaxID=1910 RepID=UPI0037018D46
MSSGAHTHGAEDLCEAGAEHYARALREGRVPSHCLARATRREALIVQTGRRPAGIMRLLPRDLALVQRGGRLRPLYQHTQRHSLPVIASYEHLVGDAAVRILFQVTQRLSDSSSQLGHLIAGSGMLKQDGGDGP